jgi:nicotinamide phosphoribosyltransferase
MSSVLWKPSTSATTAKRYRAIFEKFARESGETDLSFVDWQGHDFSFRGMSGLEDAVLSGIGHLTCFSGTDSIPAILAAKYFYGAALTVGGSVPATEHSVMCAGTKDGEFDTFKRLLTETYPDGIVSIVSDTWDLWEVLTDYVPRLKDVILARKDGKMVIRPDSGDPVKIMCGDPDSYGPAHFGTLRLLADALGVDAARAGLPMIRNAGAIYGDSITPERAEQILYRCVHELKLSPFNAIFGIGSYTYEYVTRDTYGFAMKATAVVRGGRLVPIFKSPKTDNTAESKKSRVGIPCVYQGGDGRFSVKDNCHPEDLDCCAFRKVFEDGKLLVDPKFDEIRKRVRS